MRRSLQTLRISAFVLVVGFSVAHADPATPSLDRHQTRQAQRIAAGVRSGDLSAGEAGFLRHEQLRLRLHEAWAKHDGRLTIRERTRLRSEPCQASRDITRLRQNDRRRSK